jgi:hypothetical protein
VKERKKERKKEGRKEGNKERKKERKCLIIFSTRLSLLHSHTNILLSTSLLNTARPCSYTMVRNLIYRNYSPVCLFTCFKECIYNYFFLE